MVKLTIEPKSHITPGKLQLQNIVDINEGKGIVTPNNVKQPLI